MIDATLDTYHHLISTASIGMAGGEGTIVDLRGRVHGLSGLLVIDASIFPNAVSTATDITNVAVTEHLAALMAWRHATITSKARASGVFSKLGNVFSTWGANHGGSPRLVCSR